MKRSILTGILTALACLALTAGAAGAASRITTLDGAVMTGDIQSLQNGLYTIRTPYGTQSVPAASVRSIESDPPAGSGATPTPPSVASTGPLRLAGSTTIGDELAPALLEAYATEKGATDLDWTQEGSAAEQTLRSRGTGGREAFAGHLSRHGSGTAFTALEAGNADIGMASRPITPQEIAKLSAAGLGDVSLPGQENVLALDGLIVVVNKANPLKVLSMAQIRDIYAGRVTDWSQVGGTAGPIHLVGRDGKSGTADTFNALVMGGVPVAPRIAVVEGSEGVALKVQGDPDAVGYAGFAYLGDNKALGIGTACGLEFPPADLSVRTEEYPLSRRLFLYTPAASTNAETKPFVDFALGEKGQTLAKRKGFIDLVPLAAPVAFGRDAIAIDFVALSNDAAAMRDDFPDFARYARYAVNGNRVSTTFRFRFASSALDARAVRDIDRLAEFLRTPAVAGRSVVIAGFADAVGTPLGSRQLSETRAKGIDALLRGKGIVAKEVIGFGRVAPVACNTSADGREKNRRVEIWLE